MGVCKVLDPHLIEVKKKHGNRKDKSRITAATNTGGI